MMTESTNTIAEEFAEGDELECAPKKPLWWRILKGTLIAVGALIAVLIVVGILLWNFGGMSGSVHPELLTQYSQMVAAGQEPPIQARFVIGIPGCQCHSTDPVLTAQHTRRHMNECGSCHSTNPAHMEPGVL
ncbi:MAG: hypothetical protein P4L93_05445 [Coriobacteriia bacterium]|nr:hypothetical protein [Coriobacteriia bacterium]